MGPAGDRFVAPSGGEVENVTQKGKPMGNKTLNTLTAFLLFTILLPLPLTWAQSPMDPSAPSGMGKNGYIDVHNHLFGMTGKGSPLGRSTDYPGAARAAVSLMDSLDIGTAIVMPPPFTEGQRDVFEADEFLSAIRDYPGRFAFMGGGGSLNVMIQKAAKTGKTDPDVKKRFEEQAEKIVALGAVGFGEMTAEHFSLHPMHPYETAPPDHPFFLLLADIAARHDIPIDLHMEAIPHDMPLPDIDRVKAGNNPATLKANIPGLERLLSHNPKARIIWAHAGWDNTGYRTPKLMDDLLSRHPNLYMTIKFGDDSVAENRPLAPGASLKLEWLELMKKYSDRFMMGTDQFFTPPFSDMRRKPGRGKPTKAFFSQLPPDLAHKIGVENPGRVFHLKI
jgi:predicted TIM-barrel fold metal-dependent hydrolase